MKNQRLLTVILGVFLGSVSFGQRPDPSSSQKPAEGDVVRITTNLVQVDAVITDKNGKPITDLKPEELQLFENNRSQKITHFSYIAADATGPSQSKPIVRNDKTPGVPPDRLRPEDVRRTIALIVDDLGLSFPSTHSVRRALKQFVDQQMQPGDLVAIIRTSGGIGALQQFTSDRRQLYAAIDHIKWYPGGRSEAGAFAPIGPATPGKLGGEVDAKNKELEEFRSDLFSVGTLGAISYVVRGLSDLPGRKSILLISDGFKIMDREPLSRTSRNDRTLDRLQQLIDETSRASVVIHTINASGLQARSSLRAEDSLASTSNPSGARTADQVEQALRDRNDDALDLQSGLDYLADETGGIAIHNSNDLAGGIKKIIDDRSYYLIGYRPDQTTFDNRGRLTFHHLSLKVLRSGNFNVRMRNGFYNAVSDERPKAAAADAREQIAHALISPFDAAGVPIRLTSLFANDATVGSFMRSLLHVDGSALTFTDEPDDWHQAQFDVVAVTFGADGKIVDEVSRVDRLRVRGEAYERVLKAGFVYLVTVPIKKPGAYQLRVALRDQASERVGSSSQFVEVPDMKKRRLAISGILLGVSDQAQSTQPVLSNFDPANSAAVRQFRQGENMRYSFVIYNPHLDPATGQPQLQTQVRVFREGQPVFTGRAQRFPLNNPPDMSRLSAASAIKLGADMTPGEYVLQVIVTDLLAGDKYGVASAWVDFKIVP
jgi:VWFA-related protein